MKDASKILKGKKFIKKEIEKKLGSEMCAEVWNLANEKLEVMIEKYSGLPKGVEAHTRGFIFPAAAIYLSLK